MHDDILIIGAGLGGLTLAQSLRHAGIACRVFERDNSPWERPQGYRLHLDADGITAAHEVLPPDLRLEFDATSYTTRPFTTLMRTDLSVIKRLPADDIEAPTHANVDRASLRRILLSGLDDVVTYGTTLEGYTADADGVTASFENGRSVRGSLLVGADGIRSAVRMQRAPACQTVDAGITAIYGRIPLARVTALAPRETLDDIFTIAIDDRKVFLGLGTVRFSTRPQDDYVACVVGGQHRYFSEDREGLKSLPGAALHAIAKELLAEWGDRARGMLAAVDAATVFLVEMFSSVPGSMAPSVNVTLLGDAIHAMTPTLGRGANLAMRDGAALGRAIASARNGDTDISTAIAGYEREMLAYGFKVVREAARLGEARMGQTPLPD